MYKESSPKAHDAFSESSDPNSLPTQALPYYINGIEVTFLPSGGDGASIIDNSVPLQKPEIQSERIDSNVSAANTEYRCTMFSCQSNCAGDCPTQSACPPINK